MATSVDRRTLHDALKELAKLTSPKSALPILNNVLLRASSGMLRLTTTDITSRLSAELPAEGDALTAALPAKLLAKLVKPESRRDAGEVTFEVDGENTIVTVDGLATRLPGADPAEFPSAFPAEDWRLCGLCDAAPLQEALSWVLPATSSDPTRPHLASVFIAEESVVATDGHRMHLTPTPVAFDQPVLLASTAATILSRILKATGGQAVLARHTTDDHDLLRVRCGSFELTTRLKDDQFPPYQQVIPDKASQETAVIFDVPTLAKALRRVMQLSDRGNVRVCINGAVTLSPSGYSLGEAKVIVPAIENNHAGEDLELGLDGKYLTDALLKGITKVDMSFGKSLDPVRLDLPGERLAVIMPIRI